MFNNEQILRLMGWFPNYFFHLKRLQWFLKKNPFQVIYSLLLQFFIDNNSILLIPPIPFIVSSKKRIQRIATPFIIWNNNIKYGMTIIGERQFCLSDFIVLEFSCHDLSDTKITANGTTIYWVPPCCLVLCFAYIT
jgi:hypothetical protein